MEILIEVMFPIEAPLNIYWWPALCPSEMSPQYFSYEWHSALFFSFYTLTNQQFIFSCLSGIFPRPWEIHPETF